MIDRELINGCEKLYHVKRCVLTVKNNDVQLFTIWKLHTMSKKAA